MTITHKTRSILRKLAEEVAEIASLSIHEEKKRAWSNLNGLTLERPLVWINEIPWHEMDVDEELTLQTDGPLERQIEFDLRCILYQWKHMRGDMVVENRYCSYLAIKDTGFGIKEDAHVIAQDSRGGIIAREFYPQIHDENDLEKIQMPLITHDEVASRERYEKISEVIGDILPVKTCGVTYCWFAPWDELVRWWGVQEALTDLVMRPELVHKAMDRLTNAYLYKLKQWEEMNLLSLPEYTFKTGSGGLAYTDELPQPGFIREQVRSCDQWGCSASQIFSEVSPAMHEEFALRYEMRWLENFGLNAYGCCEPLHNKIDIIRKIPNLRKISISPRADLEKAVEEIGTDYVVSYKPNPAIFAFEKWDPKQARRELEAAVVKSKGCNVEIIMKDISTVCNQPQRLWEWERIATEVVSEYS